MDTRFAQSEATNPYFCPFPSKDGAKREINLLKPTAYVMHQQV